MRGANVLTKCANTRRHLPAAVSFFLTTWAMSSQGLAAAVTIASEMPAEFLLIRTLEHDVRLFNRYAQRSRKGRPRKVCDCATLLWQARVRRRQIAMQSNAEASRVGHRPTTLRQTEQTTHPILQNLTSTTENVTWLQRSFNIPARFFAPVF